MNEDDKIEWLEKAKNKLFSKEEITKGEWIQIGLVILLIVIIIVVSLKTTCKLDCNMCVEAGQTLIQKGVKRW